MTLRQSQSLSMTPESPPPRAGRVLVIAALLVCDRRVVRRVRGAEVALNGVLGDFLQVRPPPCATVAPAGQLAGLRVAVARRDGRSNKLPCVSRSKPTSSPPPTLPPTPTLLF